MDWFSWLSKTALDPSLVYEYGLSFSRNELEEDDIPYFNHEFLQSMGISIAKHRLEILKLATREKGTIGSTSHLISRLLFAIKRTKRRLISKYIHTRVSRDDSALILMPRHGYSSRLKGDVLKRNKRLMIANNQERLLLTNGSLMVISGRVNSFSSPMVHELSKYERMDGGDDDEDNGYWSTGVEEIRWDTMFQNLKPT